MTSFLRVSVKSEMEPEDKVDHVLGRHSSDDTKQDSYSDGETHDLQSSKSYESTLNKDPQSWKSQDSDLDQQTDELSSRASISLPRPKKFSTDEDNDDFLYDVSYSQAPTLNRNSDNLHDMSVQGKNSTIDSKPDDLESELSESKESISDKTLDDVQSLASEAEEPKEEQLLEDCNFNNHL